MPKYMEVHGEQCTSHKGILVMFDIYSLQTLYKSTEQATALLWTRRNGVSLNYLHECNLVVRWPPFKVRLKYIQFGNISTATAHTGRQTELHSSVRRNFVQTREGTFVPDCKKTEFIVTVKGKFRCDLGGTCQVTVDCQLASVTVE